MARAVLTGGAPNTARLTTAYDQQQQQQTANQTTNNSNENNHFVPVDADFVRSYIQRATVNQVTMLAQDKVNDNDRDRDRDNDRERQSLEQMIDFETSAFGAIYRPVSIKPLFGPIVDGSIVTDDVINTILDSGANATTFHNYDLLIGVSSPYKTRILKTNVAQANDHQQQSNKQQQQRHSSTVSLSANFLYNQLSNLHEHQRVSYEQVIELITKFVRTFYKYHNQVSEYKMTFVWLQPDHLTNPSIN